MSEFAREELRRFPVDCPTVLTIGNFDGVHLGHQYLVRQVMAQAEQHGMAAGAVTLYPDPVRVLRPEEPMQYLTSLEERIELLRGLGLDLVVPLSFTSELAELTPRSFLGLLKEQLNLGVLVMGPDNVFGRNREGTPERVRETGQELGFEVEVLPAPLTDGTPVSATAIRRALAEGDLDAVTRQLGRWYSLRGPVVRGDQRGRGIGFPTANIAVTADRAMPAFGVYATFAHVRGKRYAGATNIGMRPTFNGQRPSVETYIIDFEGDIYDDVVRIELVARLRPEQRFNGIEEIKAQIARDVEQARELLAALP
ncbi:MAG: bifunctional riboflavin kinase/FAD synthetase [Dehalococcoidia bacterium]